jgi:hypothetical protein
MSDLTAARTKAQAYFELAKAQRLAWSCAVVVGLFLVLVGHVPFLSVLAGSILAVAISTMRAWPRLKPKPVVRAGR